MVQTFLQLDSATISDPVKALIRSNHTGLSHIGCDIGVVQFNPVAFCHALMLLGQSPNRFGYNLSLYLSTVKIFFEQVNVDGFLVIGDGSVEFKKRVSEDMGVGLAALFMVTAFQLRWETIAQIPANAKLSKYRPDFLGFNGSDQRFIFEAKGTTRPDKVEDAMNKALEQAKSYSDETVGKFAIVSYFPSGGKQLPPFTFVADPPVADLFPPTSRNSMLIHYLKVLEFCGFQRTRVAYEAVLAEIFSFERKGEPFSRSSYMSWGTQDKMRAVVRAYGTEDREEYRWKDRIFVGQYLQAKQGERQLSVFLGVDKDYIERVLRLETDLPPSKDLVIEEEREVLSIFSDGTIFRVALGE